MIGANADMVSQEIHQAQYNSPSFAAHNNNQMAY